MMQILLNIYIISFIISGILYLFLEYGIFKFIIDLIFGGKLTEEQEIKLKEKLQNETDLNIDDYINNLDDNYIDQSQILLMVICPPFYIATVIMCIYDLIKFRQQK